jgi:hypothetical protein
MLFIDCILPQLLNFFHPLLFRVRVMEQFCKIPGTFKIIRRGLRVPFLEILKLDLRKQPFLLDQDCMVL